MTRYDLFHFTFRTSALAVLLAISLTGCTKKPIDDATLTNNVHAALAGDAAIASEPIQLSVVNGDVTLTGNVSNDTARAVAAQDAAKVPGVQRVINSLTIQGLALAPTITTPAAPSTPRTATVQERQIIASHQPLPPPPPQNAPPKPLPPPIYRNINVPPGTGVSVRINQALSSENTPEGATFSGVVASNVVVNGEVAIPAGASVSGRVVAVHEATHYKGHALLSLELTGINRRGEHVAVTSDPYTIEGKNRGANTAEKVGGGAAVGAILGGIFGGGKGAAIGAAAGGGGGAVLNGVTRGQQVVLPSESIVRFHLADGFTVRSYGRSDDPDDNVGNGGLQQRQP